MCFDAIALQKDGTTSCTNKTLLKFDRLKACIWRGHIACALLGWIQLTGLARKTQQTVYRIKHGILDMSTFVSNAKK